MGKDTYSLRGGVDRTRDTSVRKGVAGPPSRPGRPKPQGGPTKGMKGSRISKNMKTIMKKSVREPGGIKASTRRALRAELRSPGVSAREKALIAKLVKSVRQNTTPGEAQGVRAAIKKQQARSVKRARANQLARGGKGGRPARKA